MQCTIWINATHRNGVLAFIEHIEYEERKQVLSHQLLMNVSSMKLSLRLFLLAWILQSPFIGSRWTLSSERTGTQIYKVVLMPHTVWIKIESLDFIWPLFANLIALFDDFCVWYWFKKKRAMPAFYLIAHTLHVFRLGLSTNQIQIVKGDE